MKRLASTLTVLFIVVAFLMMPLPQSIVAQDMVPNSVFHVAWSGDGSTFALVDLYGVSIYQLDNLDAEPVQFGAGLGTSITDVVLSSDGALAATLHDTTVLEVLAVEEELSTGLGWVWDTATGERLYGLTGHEQLFALFTVAFDPDGAFVAYGGVSNGYILVKDAVSGEEIASLNPRSLDPDWEPGLAIFPLDGLLFVPDSPFMLARNGGLLSLWDTSSWEIVAEFTAHDDIRGIEIAPSGDRIVAMDALGTPRLWQIDGATQLSDFEVGTMDVEAVGFDTNGTAVAIDLDDDTGEWTLIDIESGAESELTIDGLEIPEGQPQLEFLENGYLMIRDANNTLPISIVNIEDGSMVAQIGDERLIRPMLLNNDDTQLVFSTATGIALVDLQSGEIVGQIEVPQEGPLPEWK